MSEKAPTSHNTMHQIVCLSHNIRLDEVHQGLTAPILLIKQMWLIPCSRHIWTATRAGRVHQGTCRISFLKASSSLNSVLCTRDSGLHNRRAQSPHLRRSHVRHVFVHNMKAQFWIFQNNKSNGQRQNCCVTRVSCSVDYLLCRTPIFNPPWSQHRTSIIPLRYSKQSLNGTATPRSVR